MNGPFMRYDKSDPNNNEKKSLLDLVVVSTDLLKYIERLEVDKELKWTPSRGSKGILKHSDHYALLLTFKDVPMSKSKPAACKKERIWNTRCKNGWNVYKEKTENTKCC